VKSITIYVIKVFYGMEPSEKDPQILYIFVGRLEKKWIVK
jgi:hypothetical protein